ncbi:TetR family transcriptional regulator [Nocardioides baekrokdamisoli]|uniref:TetR family transcriptional regulator n=1 Tax=Nocardioides baekrokdamisoli TaxID=1804624 RepID=A0A3G9ICU0_9ACTN|nr:TetR/AcrR family transcriptional regulator [Nocardioides baekrokdamisoli]BBH16166.1 TetR family transcriptional regulator [Nocardioides baekrokdamisoli]
MRTPSVSTILPGRADGRQARWDDHNAERRAQIVEAAIEVVEAGELRDKPQIQQIAEAAGLSRTVVYRHFGDRADLDLAIHSRIIEDVRDAIIPALVMDGTIPELIDAGVGAYVHWAAAHPALHRLADHDTASEGPFKSGVDSISGDVVDLIRGVAGLLGVAIPDELDTSLDTFVHGILGAALGSVRRWLEREGDVTEDLLARVLGRSLWFLIDGHARDAGIVLDPDQRISDLVGDLV